MTAIKEDDEAKTPGYIVRPREAYRSRRLDDRSRESHGARDLSPHTHTDPVLFPQRKRRKLLYLPHTAGTGTPQRFKVFPTSWRANNRGGRNGIPRRDQSVEGNQRQRDSQLRRWRTWNSGIVYIFMASERPIQGRRFHTTPAIRLRLKLREK
ncbi:uncharacterized protein LOC128875141 [Hylaeus volcanicus]|uniref:uncharacterized protein LOC128875141 n=1 Tax=Hylaeus volcanicus TaxID=313075 RepID=UPI0023B83EA8|nr:uncharacterized protein LOC128875141 [Hylaeus volcanicus]